MNIVACTITREKDRCQTKIFQNLQKINNCGFDGKIELKIKCGNTKMGLSEYYNNCIDNYAADCDYMIFVHDDVEFLNMDLHYQIKESMKIYDVVGVAGCLNPNIKDLNLWHLMCERSNLRGFAGHTCSETGNQFHVTSFGPSPSRVAMIDGVFMVINCKKILESKVKFDENFMFHHYDLDFSNTCNLNRLKIGVYPILINHSSPGLREFSDSWKKSNEYFKQKWTAILKK